MEQRETITRYELLRVLENKAALPKYQAEFVFDTLMESIADHIKDGKEVMLPKIGRFIFVKSNVTRKSRLSNHMLVPHYRVRFRMNQGLARYVRVETREE